MNDIAPPQIRNLFADIFVMLCGAQVGIFIQFRKVEMGYDGFWNKRLLLLILATALAMLLVSRLYARFLAIVSRENLSRIYFIEAFTYCPQFIFITYPLLRMRILPDQNVSFKITFLSVACLILLMKLYTISRYFKIGSKTIFKASGYGLLLIAVLALLGLHYVSLSQHMHRPGGTAIHRKVGADM